MTKTNDGGSHLIKESGAFDNYSIRIKRVLDSKKISPGDKILIKKDTFSIIGYILPKSDFGDPDFIHLKLENGYNIGVYYDSSVEISRISNGFLPKFFFSNKIEKKSMHQKVALITTGGTISSRIDYGTGGVSVDIKPDELITLIPELHRRVFCTNVGKRVS